MKKFLIFSIALPIYFLGFFTYSLAQQNAPAGGSGTTPPVGGSGTTYSAPLVPLTNPIKANDVQEILLLAVNLAIFIGTIIAVLMFIFIGFKFVLAQGNETKIADAKKWFMYAAIGTAVLISSKVIVEVIENTFVSTGIVDQSLFENK